MNTMPQTAGELCAALGITEADIDQAVAEFGRLAAMVGRSNPIREIRVGRDRLFSIDPGFLAALRAAGINPEGPTR